MIFKQDNRFTGGMRSEINDLNQATQVARLVKNMSIRQRGNVFSLVREPDDMEVDWGAHAAEEPADYEYAAMFRASLNSREFLLLFVNYSVGGGGIYVHDPSDNTIIKLHDDRALNTSDYDRVDALSFSRGMDCVMFAEGDITYAMWAQGGDRPRAIPLVFDPAGSFDQTGTTGTYTGLANCADCLYLQELAPESTIDISTAASTELARLQCGSYQFAYRYVNMTSGKTSRISVLSAPYAIVPSEDGEGVNSVTGGGTGTFVSQAVSLSVAPASGYHRTFYDGIQFFVVEWIGNADPIVRALAPEAGPSGHFALNTPTALEKFYHGNEASTIYTIDELLEVKAPIDSCLTLEEVDGRLVLGGIEYTDLRSGMTWQNNLTSGASTEEILESFTSIDPLQNPTLSGYYGPDANLNKGYRGDEVYRFAVSYHNKFQEFSYPDRVTFNQARYDPASHASTYTRNWADSGCPDWKFPKRHTPQTSLVDLNSVRMWGMSIEIQAVPSWAFGVMMVRRNRIKNIIAMTPIVKAMSITGGHSHIDGEIADDSTIIERPWLSPGNYDGNGIYDTYEPQVFAYGHLQHITLGEFAGTVNTLKRIYFPKYLKTREQDYDLSYLNADSPENSLLYLYPLEFLANDSDQAFGTEDIEGANIEVFDCVMTTAYNAVRAGEVEGTLTSARVKSGAAARYAWIYAPEDGDAYWSNNNTSFDEIWERGADAYTDGNIAAAPSSVRIGKAYTIGYASLATTISPASSDEKTAHINRVNGLLDLWQDQSNNDIGIFKNSDYRLPGPIVNQRAILVTQEPSPVSTGEVRYIQDPTAYIKTHYQDGAGNYALLFPSAPNISTDTETLYNGALAIDDISGTRNPVIIDPGSAVPIFLANITKGLQDDRYGSDSQEAWFPCMQPRGLDASEVSTINGGTPLALTFYGGDCIVTRSMIKIRDNAPLITTIEASDEEDAATNKKYHQYQANYGDTTPGSFGTRVGRVTGYENFVEVLDLWVESDVNGHWVFRNRDSYPTGFNGREADADDLVTYPDYEHDGDTLQKMLSPYLYLYNFGYSKQQDVTSLFSRLPFSREINKPYSRVHFSPQRVYGEWEWPFQRYLVGDFYDLSAAAGEIKKLLSIGRNRMIAIQEDDVSALFVGVSVSEDADGQQFVLSSGRFIGEDQSLTSAESSMPMAGTNAVRDSVNTPYGIFFLDRDRKIAGQITAGGVRDISTLDVDLIINDLLDTGSDPASSLTTWTMYEHEYRRVWFCAVYNDGVWPNFRAISYLADADRWESYWDIPRDSGGGFVNNIVSLAQGSFAIKSTPAPLTGQDTLYERRKGPAFGNVFGSLVDSAVTYILNNTEHSASGKILHTVQVQGDGEPSAVQAQVFRGSATEQDSGDVSLGKERQGTFIFVSFRANGAPGTRIRSEQIEVTVKYSGAEEKSLESIQTTYGIDRRSKLR